LTVAQLKNSFYPNMVPTERRNTCVEFILEYLSFLRTDD
jgi:hypothetical protein